MNYVNGCGRKRDVSLQNPRKMAIFLKTASSMRDTR